MNTAKLLWTPYPYRAGFCITDDTDAADFASVKIVYDFLRSIAFPTTKTVWAFEPVEPCGIPPTPASTLRGVTLEDSDYLEYCKELSRNGYEIALHGASAGNNRREFTERAFRMAGESFGSTATFICHSKNADNIYWEERVVSNRAGRLLLSSYSRHQTSGEVEESDYFWGDICRRRVKQIRLWRTRKLNTLRANPSMPYYDPSKPYVNGWFSATKRSLKDCASTDALDDLKEQNGLTILYQYLHRYADRERGEVQDGFAQDCRRLAADPEVWIDTVGNIMERLRLLQGIFIVDRDNVIWLVNVNNTPVSDVQIALPEGAGVEESDLPYDIPEGNLLRIGSVPQESVSKFTLSSGVSFTGRRAKKAGSGGRTKFDFGHGRLYVNLSERAWQPGGGVEVKAAGFRLEFEEGLEDRRPLSKCTALESLRLFSDQVDIIMREVLYKGRSLDADAYLSGEEIPLENHDNW